MLSSVFKYSPKGKMMNGLRSTGKMIGNFAVVAFFFSAILSTGFFTSEAKAQTTTNNQYIWAEIDPSNGWVTVRLPPGRATDPQLSFQNKSYFTCQVGPTYYTNNEVIAPFPANAKRLNDGVTVKIADTLRTTWANKNGVDIIQDVYPVAFTKSGQIVYKWKIFNKSGTFVGVQCQYLQDVQITDPPSLQQPNSNDGPIILTRWTYKAAWETFPSNGQTLPWFYIGFLYDLPNANSFNPGLSAMGYLDYGAPLNLIKPTSLTIGDWYIMANTIFGVNPSWPGNGTSYGSPADNAVLTVFPPNGVQAGKTLEIGRTSYGTGEYERCVGTLFSVVFYPHHFVWDKTILPNGGYIPDSIHIEKYVFNALNTASPNTKITLNLKNSLFITDSLGKKNISQSQVQPPAPSTGTFINAGSVGYFDWWIRADPRVLCKAPGTLLDTLRFTGTCGICPPAFLNSLGGDECDLPIYIDCAELDQDAPEYSDTLADDCHSQSVNVHDWRKTDRGLQSITWKPQAGTDPTKFTITVQPPVAACYNDKVNHIVTVTKSTSNADSTVKGCFDFTFTDCIGHVSSESVCLKACKVVSNPDLLPPFFTLNQRSGSFDGSDCNNRRDSFVVTDSTKYDAGIDSVKVIPGTDDNMQLNLLSFSKCSPIAHFSVSVQDSMKDGSICIRASDCSPKHNYTDTCFHYCTIKDTLAPRITITKDPTRSGKWFVQVKEDSAWDRGIDTIYIVGATPSITPQFVLRSNYSYGALQYGFPVVSTDTTQTSSFCVEAKDLAGNRSKSNIACGSQGVGRDSLCPNILINPDPKTNPTSVMVDVNDIHYLNPPTNTDLYVWDSGVDSVWADPSNGMSAPSLPISGLGRMTIPPFKISVSDTTQIDSVACITIHAKDKKGNECTATYCYPYTPDSKPPVITIRYNPANKSQVLGTVTDNANIFDRGLKSIITSNEINLTSISLGNLAGAKIIDLGLPTPQITRANLDQSSSLTLTAVDLWGSTPPYSAINHTASVDFYFFVQDFAMKKAVQPDQGSTFYIPVYFVKNDNFPVSLKRITDFTFSFSISGDVNSITFDHVATADPATIGWTLTPTINGTSVTITGSMAPSGAPLAAAVTSNTSDSLVLIYFKATKDQSVRQASIIIDSIQFNKGRDTLYVGTSATALMPAPYGNLSGSNIVITGACSPKITTDNLHPTSVSLDPPHPNPFSRTTTFNYTVAEDGPVRFAIYDELGKEVARIVNQDQKQGSYTVTFDASTLSGGSYVARLQSGNTVLSRRIGVER